MLPSSRQCSDVGCVKYLLCDHYGSEQLSEMPAVYYTVDARGSQDGKGKVKFSHTRYRALGPEQIPVYRQSARR